MALSLAACRSEPEAPPVATTAQQVRAGVTTEGGVMVGADVLVMDEQGQGIPCGEGVVEMDLEVSRNGQDGPWVLVERSSVDASCIDSSDGELALVIDNSGSLRRELEVLQQGASRAVARVLGSGGRVSLTRVSSDSTVLSPLTDDPQSLASAIDGLHIANGWTALWDGVRMGNETLGVSVAGAELMTHDGAAAFCAASPKRALLLFTDGEENNSSHQSHWSDDYPGDAMDTSFEDLQSLNVGGVQTPLYIVGLGREVDSEALGALAEGSGGRFIPLDDLERVDDVLETISEHFASSRRFCAEVPSHLCGVLDVRVTHRWTDGERVAKGTGEHRLDVPCDARARGRVATLLLALRAAEVSEATRGALLANTVNWVSPVDAPRVLFVLDDFHHGEDWTDTKELFEMLAETGYSAEYLEEPEHGLTLEDVEGYDVVWFSNPGYPIDDAGTFSVLLQFSQAGGGVVLQGDDMGAGYGNAFATTPLTRLDYVDNGTKYCGRHIDNGRSASYEVRLADSEHPVLSGIAGLTFLYGDDIDTTTPAPGGEVLAWATADGKRNCEEKPVIVTYTPEAP